MTDNTRWWPKREQWPEFPPVDINGKMRRIYYREALALLILDGAVFLLRADSPDEDGASVIGIYANCNDLFYWGRADGEAVPPVGFSAESDKPFWVLYDAYRATGDTDEWSCLRRGMRPQWPVEKRMRESGAWTAALEALPERGEAGRRMSVYPPLVEYDVWVCLVNGRQTYKAVQVVGPVENAREPNNATAHLDRVTASSKRLAVTQVVRKMRANMY